jgi:predicted regulator of Ras-like GTPase activity (Roadblock/LC7/MglB family)
MAIVYRTELLEAALARLCSKLRNVQGAVIVSIEGFVVASYAPASNTNNSPEEEAESINSPQVAAMAATLIALGERTLSRLAQGELSRLLLEGSSGAMLVVPASRRAAVALMVNNNAKMGLSLYALRQTAQEISTILEGE